MDPNEFYKYATRHQGISSMTLQRYTSIWNNYISPTIIEERQLNIASMDVFSRLMMDRIIFLGFVGHRQYLAIIFKNALKPG